MRNLATIAIIFFLSEEAIAAPKNDLPDESIPKRLTFEAPADHFRDWIRPLPCPTGSFSSVITVLHPAEHAKFQSGALIATVGKDDGGSDVFFHFGTVKRLLPLRASVQELRFPGAQVLKNHLMDGIFGPGNPITFEMTWVNRQSFSFSVNGGEQYTLTLPQPATTFRLAGVGSYTVFDNNVIHCNLIS